ncbi:MAG: hypothetical protein KKB37_17285 [Alphaproteobacteria bacterium]|nr:hypothetical protein [Alphaproteobacteria bacterium]
MTSHDNTTQTADATNALFSEYWDPKKLAFSLRMTISYLRSCAGKHESMETRSRANAKRCNRIAKDLEQISDHNAALVRYRDALCELDLKQLKAFQLILIDYQARIGSEFVPTSTSHYLADLTAMIFALEAMDEPLCLAGVGGGFAPRFSMRPIIDSMDSVTRAKFEQMTEAY